MAYALGVISIFLSYQSKKREVAAFLDELHQLLESDDFDINMDLILIRKKKQGDDWKFSTPYTLLDLEYNAEDVVNRLKELKVEKDINDRLIYVKLKIRDQQKQIVCVSFHYAKDKMQYPYA